MKRKHLICVCLFFLLGAGCLTEPPGQTLTDDPGPFPQDYQKIILCYLNYYLDDPGSLKDFEITKPPEIVTVDTFYPFIPLSEGQKVWEAFIVFNARNESGEYTGRDLHVVWIRHHKIVAFDYKDIDYGYSVKQRLGDPCASGERG